MQRSTEYLANPPHEHNPLHERSGASQTSQFDRHSRSRTRGASPLTGASLAVNSHLMYFHVSASHGRRN